MVSDGITDRSAFISYAKSFTPGTNWLKVLSVHVVSLKQGYFGQIKSICVDFPSIIDFLYPVLLWGIHLYWCNYSPEQCYQPRVPDAIWKEPYLEGLDMKSRDKITSDVPNTMTCRGHDCAYLNEAF